MLVADETEMAHAVAHVGAIDPVRCRESVRARYDIAIVADGYEAVYRQAMRRARSRLSSTRRGQTRAVLPWRSTDQSEPVSTAVAGSDNHT
jgi:hypothetical protein